MIPRDPRIVRAVQMLAERSQLPYSPHAYLLVLGAIMQAIERPDHTRREHISAQDITEMVATLALEQYGPFAYGLLARWNVHSTLDFGKIVFELIRGRLLVQSDEDTLQGFEGVYDFRERFLAPFDGEPPFPDTPRIRLS